MNAISPVAGVPARIQAPDQSALEPYGVNQTGWSLLVNTLYPDAPDAGMVLALLEFCARRKYDPFRRPVHLVAQYNAKTKKSEFTIWPGINSIRADAAATGLYAGMDKPEWGPDRTETMKGRVKQWDSGRESYGDQTAEVTYPDYCTVTVYRLVAGQRCAFPFQVFWKEAYQTRGMKGSTLPNDMWEGRARGQLQKCAEAGALRAAFPELADYTFEEMAGRNHGAVIDAQAEHGKVEQGTTAAGPAQTRSAAEQGRGGPAAAFRGVTAGPAAGPAQGGTTAPAAGPGPVQQVSPNGSTIRDVDPTTGEVLAERSAAVPPPAGAAQAAPAPAAAQHGALYVALPQNDKGGIAWGAWLETLRHHLSLCKSEDTIKALNADNGDALIKLNERSSKAWLSWSDSCTARALEIQSLTQADAGANDPPMPLDDEIPF